MNIEHLSHRDTCVVRAGALWRNSRLAKQLPTCRAGRKRLPSVWQSLGRLWPDRQEPSASVNIKTLQDLILEGESTLSYAQMSRSVPQFGLKRAWPPELSTCILTH